MCALCMFVFQNLLHSLMTFVCIKMQHKKIKRKNDTIVLVESFTCFYVN
jgi:hypothetical protein